MRQLVTRGTAAFLVAALLCSSAAAADDRENAEKIAAQWQTGLTIAQIDALVAAGWRLVDLEVEDPATQTFAAALVKNEAAYQKTFWWFPKLTAAEIGAKVVAHTARLVDMEPYVQGGTVYYATVFVANTGADQKPWNWKLAATSAVDLVLWASNSGLRLANIESYVHNANTYYCGIGILNTGANQRTWYYRGPVQPQDVETMAASLGARLVDVERRTDGDFDLLCQSGGPTGPFRFVHGHDAASLQATAKQLGARVADLETYVKLGKRYFSALLIRNLTADEENVAKVFEGKTDGRYGFRLMAYDETLLANLMSDEVFEPAEALHVLVHFHGARVAANDYVKLTDMIEVDTGSVSGCPGGGLKVQEKVEDALRRMMQEDDNNRAKALVDRYSMFSVNFTRIAAGMSDSLLQHTFGCTAEAALKPNKLTLENATRLMHLGLSDGFLNGYQLVFRNMMLGDASAFPAPRTGTKLATVVAQEAVKHGANPGVAEQFLSELTLAYKTGDYDFGGRSYRAVVGWVRVPFFGVGARIYRAYTFALFLDGASDAKSADLMAGTGASELLRGLLSSAIETWKTYVPGTTAPIGTGCSGSNGAPEHSVIGKPEIGMALRQDLRKGPNSSIALWWLGLSKTTWGAVPLPLDLERFGAKGCTLQVAPLVVLGLPTDATGNGWFNLNVPLDKTLIGLSLYTQLWCIDKPANALGLTFSNGVETRLGGKPW